MTTEGGANLPALPAWVAEAAKNLNLPTLLLGPAGAAISRLIGGATDIPAAWLQAKADEIKATSEAKRNVKLALAGAASAQALTDADLVDQALLSLLPEHLRKQANKEAVAQAAIEAMADLEPEDHLANAASPDPDWMNLFIRFAEDASSERMQDLWGRVLAKETASGGAFSLRTIRFLSELDKGTAEAFERISALVFDGNGVDTGPRISNELFEDIFTLEQAGLLSYGVGKLAKFITIDPNGSTSINLRKSFLTLYGKPGSEIELNCSIMTKTGCEIMQIVSVVDDEAVAKSLAGRISKVCVDKIEWCDGGSGVIEVLWSRPTP